MREIDELVVAKLKSFFRSAEQVVSALAQAGDDVATTRALVEAAQRCATELDGNAAGLNEMLAGIVSRIVVRQESVELQLHQQALLARLDEAQDAPRRSLRRHA